MHDISWMSVQNSNHLKKHLKIAKGWRKNTIHSLLSVDSVTYADSHVQTYMTLNAQCPNVYVKYQLFPFAFSL